MNVVEGRNFWGKGIIYHVLLVSLLLLMALQPLSDFAGGFFVRLGFACVLIACIAAVASRRKLFVVGLAWECLRSACSSSRAACKLRRVDSSRSRCSFLSAS